jgi:hypothetical protein
VVVATITRKLWCGSNSNHSYVSKNIGGNKKNSSCGSNSLDVVVAVVGWWAGGSKKNRQ